MAESSAEFSPLSYLKIFFRRLELLLIPMFVGLIIGTCVGIILPKQFESSTVLLVEDGKSDNPLFDQIAVSTTVRQRMSTIRESMLGWNSLVKLVKRLELDKSVKTPMELEKLILDIRKEIDIKLRGRNIIQLSYAGEEPEMTQAVVQNITDIFIERNLDLQNQATADAIIFIEEQLNVYRGKIKSSEIAGLKDQLKVLRVDSTEQHPRVKELRQQILKKENELVAENLTYTEDVKFDPQTTNPIITEIKKALTSIEGTSATAPEVSSMQEDSDKDFYKVMLIDKLDNVMARDADVNADIYNMLLQRLETAKITQRLQSSKEGTKYTVLDPPRIPFKATKPNKILVSTAGMVGGLLIGVALVIGFEFLDKSFIDVEEAKEFFGSPLLGAISKITTEESIKKGREKVSWMYSLTFVGGCVTIILTMAVSNFLQ